MRTLLKEPFLKKKRSRKKLGWKEEIFTIKEIKDLPNCIDYNKQLMFVPQITKIKRETAKEFAKKLKGRVLLEMIDNREDIINVHSMIDKTLKEVLKK